MGEAKETKIPTGMLLAALGIFAAYGYWHAGAQGASAVLTAVGFVLGVEVVLAIIALFITAKIMGISFGYMGTAALKIAAITALAGVVSLFIPYIGWIVALMLYVILLAWLFELEGLELTVCAVVILLVRFAANILLMGLFLSH